MSDNCNVSIQDERLNVFSEILSGDPEMKSKELIARLVETHLFTKDLAIKWSHNRLEYLKKYHRIVRAKFNKYNTPQRKFLSHVYEIAHLFLAFIPEFSDCFPRISSDLHHCLNSLRESHSLVNISYIEKDKITLKFPKIYDEILHGSFSGERVNIDTRFRFWSDFKFDVLSPIKNSSDDFYIKRTFSFPEKFLHHVHLKQFIIDPLLQNISLQMIGKILIEYLQNMIGDQDLKILGNFLSRKQNIAKKVNYVSEFNKIIDSKIEEWDKLIEFR